MKHIFYVSNLLNCIKTLKEFNFEIIGAFTEHAKDVGNKLEMAILLWCFSFRGKGLSKDSLDACDIHVNLIKNDKINSLNVSVAMGIAANEVIGIKKFFKLNVKAKNTKKFNQKLSGIGLHSGEQVNIELMPSEPDTGIRFLRTDLQEDLEIPATLEGLDLLLYQLLWVQEQIKSQPLNIYFQQLQLGVLITA